MAHLEPDPNNGDDNSKFPSKDEWLAMLWTLIKTFVVTFIATVLVMGKDVFSATFDDYKVAAVPAVAAVLKVILNFFDSGNTKYGRGANGS